MECVSAFYCDDTIMFANSDTGFCSNESGCNAVGKYGDEALRFCVVNTNCDYTNPFASDGTMKCTADCSPLFGNYETSLCVDEFGCSDTSYPFADESTMTCVEALDCPSSYFGDADTHYCVLATACSSYFPFY